MPLIIKQLRKISIKLKNSAALEISIIFFSLKIPSHISNSGLPLLDSLFATVAKGASLLRSVASTNILCQAVKARNNVI